MSCIHFLSVVEMWNRHKHSIWDVYDNGGDCVGDISLEQLYVEQFSDFSSDAEACLAEHCDSVEYWVKQFTPYLNREQEIPHDWAIEVEIVDGIVHVIEDGNHRLVAAVTVGLKELPAFDTGYRFQAKT